LAGFTKSFKGDCLVELKKNRFALASNTAHPSLSKKMQHDDGDETLKKMQIGQFGKCISAPFVPETARNPWEFWSVPAAPEVAKLVLCIGV